MQFPMLEEKVDVASVSEVGGHAPGGRVRLRDETGLFQGGQDVAYRSGGQSESSLFREPTRRDRCALLDMLLNECSQDAAGSFGKTYAERAWGEGLPGHQALSMTHPLAGRSKSRSGRDRTGDFCRECAWW